MASIKRSTTFQPKDLDFGETLSRKTNEYFQAQNRKMEGKVRMAVSMAFQIAHQKRPYISNVQAKSEGRRMISKGKYLRVSDPDAQLGVPVAFINGGTLQQSIKTKFKWTRAGTRFQGSVYVDSPGIEYASFLEFGTSKMRARPFMRPAITLTREAIKSMLQKNA